MRSPRFSTSLGAARCAVILVSLFAPTLDLADVSAGTPDPESPRSTPVAPVSASGVPQVPFWPGVVDTVDVIGLSPGVRERLAEGVPFATFVPLGAAVPASRELGDLLTRIAGVHVHRYGSFGSFTTASIRASGPQQLQVLLDGFPVGGASMGIPNLSLLPIANLEYAEIFRGARDVADSSAGRDRSGQLRHLRRAGSMGRPGRTLGSPRLRATARERRRLRVSESKRHHAESRGRPGNVAREQRVSGVVLADQIEPTAGRRIAPRFHESASE